MELTGTIKHVFNEQRISDTFKKREMVLTTDEQYPQPILIEFIQERGSLLDNFRAGNKVKVSVNLRGREWTNPQGQVKYFISLHGWKIENLETQTMTTPESSLQSGAMAEPPVSSPQPSDDESGLPF